MLLLSSFYDRLYAYESEIFDLKRYKFFKVVNYQKEKQKYQLSQTPFLKKKKGFSFKGNPIDSLCFEDQEDFLLDELKHENKFALHIRELEKTTMETALDILGDGEDIELSSCYSFLYHGIRFQEYLEKLESIFQNRKILASKYLADPFRMDYYDNCNEGEYVSLLGSPSLESIEYDTFVRFNVSLVLKPFASAYKTIYIPYEEWDYLKQQKLPVKNRYSYALGEYQVKDFVPIEMVVAIGMPYDYLRKVKSISFAENYKEDIIKLMEQYHIVLPIVDTGDYNRILFQPKQKSY